MTVVVKDQADDVVKALRKAGITGRLFQYDRQKWDDEKRELVTLKESLQNKRVQLNQISSDSFQETMVALMHLKVMRALLEGAIRFGVGTKHMVGLVCPKKGAERTILTQMTNCLAEDNLREYYGEKMDVAEQDDFWPFVAIPLTSPIHVFE